MNFNQGITTLTKRLLICGPIGCSFFIGLFLLQGWLREGYDPLRFPISSLSIGDYGWIQIGNFIITGILIYLFSLGFRQATPLLKGSPWTSRLLGVAGLGLIGAGIFSTDPIFGYPVTAPLALEQFTFTGHLHDLFSILVFIGIPIACFRMARRSKENKQTGWALYSFFSGTSMLATFILAGVAFNQFWGLGEIAGFIQRLSIIIGLVWIITLSFMLIKISPLKN